MTTKFDTTAIETSLRDAIKTLSVSSNVFFNRPRSLEKNLEDFVVVRVSGGGVINLSATGRCALSICLFAKDLANQKNSKKLSVMEKKVLADFPTEIGDLLIDPDEVSVLGDTPDNSGYHARIIQIRNVIIKTA